jgi:hypothetical protein
MTKSFINSALGILAAGIAPAMLLCAAPSLAEESPAHGTQAAPTALAAPMGMHDEKRHGEEHHGDGHPVDKRIADLHKRLGITPDLEPLWLDVVNVMRDNEAKMIEHISAREAKMKTMTAVDDLRSYRMITDEHADGLKRLIPVFESLYDKMSPAQKAVADHVFEGGQHRGKRDI